MKSFKFKLLLIPLLLAITVTSLAQSIDETILFCEAGNLTFDFWRVDASGNFKLLANLLEANPEGDPVDTDAFLSKNENEVVYLKNGNLWIYDLETKHTWKVTKEGSLGDDKYYPVIVLAEGWALDGQKYLYSVKSFGYGKPGGKLHRKFRFAGDGSYIHDLKSGFSTPVSFNGWPMAWVHDNKILYQDSENSHAILKTLDLHGKVEQVWEDPKFDQLYQFTFNNSGNKILAAALLPINIYQIVEIDLLTGHLKKITEQRKDIIFVRPSYSPDEKHLAWITHKEMVIDGGLTSEYTLYVDGKPIYKGPDHDVFYYRWINNECLAILEPKDIVVMNWTNSKVVGTQARHFLAPKKQEYDWGGN